MADVLNLETESTPLSTQLETPELESVTAVAEPLPESTSNHVAPEELETVMKGGRIRAEARQSAYPNRSV